MKVAAVLPRGMCFSPQGATSIDIVARDLLMSSRHRETTFVLGAAVPEPFSDVDFRPVDAASQRDLVDRACQILRAEKPDVVIIHQHAESAHRIAGALPGTPVVLHRHGLMSHKRGFLSKWRKRRQFGRLAGIVFVSEFLRIRFLADHPGLKDIAAVVHNGIDPAFWVPAGEKQNRIAYVGRARADKGVHPVVDAFARAGIADWRLDLVLAVQTPEERLAADELHAKTAGNDAVTIQENLTLTGVRDVLAAAKIAAVPSIVEEGFHRVIIEAQACACGVIASDGGGAPEAGGEHARYVKTRANPDLERDLSEAMEQLALAPGDGQAARAAVIERYSQEKVAARYDALLEQLAAG